jgi:hypothetical protein
MMSHRRSLVRPPRLAAWLVELFVSDRRAESVAGDLVEEFSDLASRSGVAYARSWYWRQSVKTIAYLLGMGFRVAPWSTVGTIVGGFVLLRFGLLLPGRAIGAVLELRWHHVTPYFTEPQMKAYLFWFNTGVLTGRLLVSLLVGCIVATVAKGREMVATITLSLVEFALIGVTALVNLAGHWSWFGFGMFVLWNLMILTGGAFVRVYRSALPRHFSGA